MPVLGQKRDNTASPPPPSGGILRKARNDWNTRISEQEQSDFAEMNQAAQTAAQMQDEYRQRADEQQLSDQAEMDAAQQQLATMPVAEMPGRSLPVIGPVLRGLDAFSENPIVDKAASIGRELYTPGAGLSNVTTLTRGVGGVLDRVAPKLGSTFGGRVAQEAIKEGVVGVPLGAAQSLASGNPDLEDAAKAGAVGGALGAAGGAALPILGKGIQSARNAAARGLSEAPLRPEPPSTGAVKPSVSQDVTQPPTPIADVTEQASSAQPMKQSWFTNLFGNQGVGISALNSGKRIGDKPLTTEGAIVSKSIKNDADGLKAEAAAKARAAYQNFVDAFSPLKKISSTTYDTAIDSARANNLANNIIGKDFVTPEGVRLGDGLETIFSKVGRGQDKSFVDYLVLRDAETRVSRGERVYDESLNMTPENIRARREMLEKRHPGFAAIAKDWDAFTKNLRETYGVNEGLLSKAQNAAMEESRPFYTPMRRQFSRSEKPGRKWLQTTSGNAFSGQKAPIKKVSPTGSARDIIDPRKTMVEAVGAWVNASMRNRVMREIVKEINANPEGMKHIAEIVPDTAEVTKKSLDELNTLLSSDGIEGLIEKMNGEFDLAFKKGAQKGNEDNIVRAMIDGQPVKIRIKDPEVVKALTDMSPQQAGILVDLLGKFSNATKRGATGALAPLFAARSATTDLVSALIQSKNPAQHGVDLVHAIVSSIGDKLNIPRLSDLAKEFRLSGGEYSAALKGERAVNKGFGNLQRNPILSPQSVARGTGKLLVAPFKLGNAISDVAENVNRIAAYKGEMRRQGGARTPENVRNAMMQARDITTNFSRKGHFTRELESLFPYQNAAVQGTYRVMKAFKNNPVKTTAAVATLAVMPKLFEYSQFHNDPDYQKIPAREKYRNLFVSKNDDGTFVKVPMEPAYNSFGEITIEALQYLRDDNPEAFKDSMDAIMNAWTPPIVTGALQGVTQGSGIQGSLEGTLNSTSIGPILGASANRSFTGAPIESRAVEDRSPQYRYDEKTSGVAKELGKLSGWSPMKIDYILKSYGGDPARLLLPLTSTVGPGNTRNTLLKNFITDPTLTNNLANDFYTSKEKLTQANRDFKEVGVNPPSWYDEELYKLVTSQAKGSVAKRLSELTEQKKQVSADKALSPQQKTDRIRDIQSEMNDIYAEVNSKMYERGVPRK